MRKRDQESPSMEQLSRARIYNLSQTVIPSLRGISKACDLGEWKSANEHKPKGSLVPRDDPSQTVIPSLRGISKACDLGSGNQPTSINLRIPSFLGDDRNEKALAKESACDIVEREHYSILRCLSKSDTSSDMQLYYFIQNNNA